MPTTTIQIDVEVRDLLRARGRMGESYNDVIRRLLAATRSSDLAARMPTAPSGPSTRPWIPTRDRD
jgi:predicted CopG family antitoxin